MYLNSKRVKAYLDLARGCEKEYPCDAVVAYANALSLAPQAKDIQEFYQTALDGVFKTFVEKKLVDIDEWETCRTDPKEALAMLREQQAQVGFTDLKFEKSSFDDEKQRNYKFILTWPVSEYYGWGVFGLNLFKKVLRRGRRGPRVSILEKPKLIKGSPNAKLIEPYEQEQQELEKLTEKNLRKIIKIKDSVLLHAVNPNLSRRKTSQSFWGTANLGVVFLENTLLHKRMLATVSDFNYLIVGSKWNGDILTQDGANNVRLLHQGIDDTIFYPKKIEKNFKDRFVVFSGGKLEYRKGQDLIIEAFKRFVKKHPDAILMSAWFTLWANSMDSLIRNSPYLDSLPIKGDNGNVGIANWLEEMGIPKNNVFDLGFMPNYETPKALLQADVAVFPNRCEGGTNLVAMEAMACGLPCIIANNTGQKDLISDDNCYPLLEQNRLDLDPASHKGWGESSIDEILENLECAYADRKKRKKIGLRGALFMKDWTWKKQTEKLLQYCDEIM